MNGNCQRGHLDATSCSPRMLKHLNVHRHGPRTTVLRVALRLRPMMVFPLRETVGRLLRTGERHNVLRKRSAGSARRFPARVSSVGWALMIEDLLRVFWKATGGGWVVKGLACSQVRLSVLHSLY